MGVRVGLWGMGSIGRHQGLHHFGSLSFHMSQTRTLLFFLIFIGVLMIWASQVVPVVKNPSVSAEDIRDMGSIHRWRRSPGGGHGNPLQYSCLENPHGQRSLVSGSPRDHKKLDTTEAT